MKILSFESSAVSAAVCLTEGEKETLLTTTTSWAAYVVDAPLDVNNPKFQIGVRAVGKDGKTKSPITWTNKISHASQFLVYLVKLAIYDVPSFRHWTEIDCLVRQTRDCHAILTIGKKINIE